MEGKSICLLQQQQQLQQRAEKNPNQTKATTPTIENVLSNEQIALFPWSHGETETTTTRTEFSIQTFLTQWSILKRHKLNKDGVKTTGNGDDDSDKVLSYRLKILPKYIESY